jgi:hypothetical protein
MTVEDKYMTQWNGPMQRFRLAARLGPLALLRLRAEVILERETKGKIWLTPEQHETLDRIAVAPHRKDADYLAKLDHHFTAED